MCIDPEGVARAKAVSPTGEMCPLTQETGSAEECWLNRAALLGPWRLVAVAAVKIDDCCPPPADENNGFYIEKTGTQCIYIRYLHVHV